MQPNKIAIITDSTCDIPQEMIDAYSITVLPQIVIWGEVEYRDRITLQPEDFYEKLQAGETNPTSAAVTELEFEQAYQEAARNGAQEILVLSVSGAMSGTYQNAVLAAKKSDLTVEVVDSCGPTMSLGWQVLAAARLRQQGGDLQAMVARAAEVRRRLVQLVAMESIQYLQRGGRIGGAAKWVGTLLHIRPVVAINHETGLVEPVGLTRTHQKMVELLYQKFFERLERGRELHIAVLHGNVPEEAELFAARIRQDYHPSELLVNITGPVLGINTGPNALALCGYYD